METRRTRGEDAPGSTQKSGSGTAPRQSDASDDEDMDESDDVRDEDSRTEAGANRRRSIS